MIAELAAANAAYDVIKQTVANGQEIYHAAEAMAEYFGLKSELQKKAHEHGYKSDLEAFIAAEQLHAQEDELKQIMIYQGRPGMWTDWLNYKSQMKKSREEEKKEEIKKRLKRKQVLVDTIVIGTVIACGIGAVVGSVWIFISIVS